MSENENLKLKEKHFYNSKGIVSHLRFLKKKILWIFMAQLPSRAIAKKIKRYDICDVEQSSGADISGIMSDSLRVALVKLRVCSNSDSSNSLLPRSHLSLNLPPFYPRTTLIVILTPCPPPSLSFSLILSFAHIDAHPAAASFRRRAVAALFNQ